MKFTREQIFDAKEIENEIIDQGRWNTVHQRIFEYEGHYYEIAYSEGSTEIQDEGPMFDGENSDGVVECQEVHQVERLVKVWEPV